MTGWENHERIAAMTRSEAAYVRRLRVEEDDSWRGIAYECSRQWGGDWGDNQRAGMELCRRAALLFGEDYMSSPWN